MLILKAVLIILNTLSLIGALGVLIYYVKKTAEIATLSKSSITDLKKNSEVSKKAVELSKNVLLEMRESRASLMSPRIIAYFERGDEKQSSYLFFIIENIGVGIARNISLSFTPPLIGEDIESVERIIRIGKNIDSLPPNFRMKNLFGRIGRYIDVEDDAFEDLHSDLPRKFEVEVVFEDAATSDHYEYKYPLDLGVPLGNCAQ